MPAAAGESVKQPDALEMLKLGNKYYFGNGVKKDLYEAVKWYRMAAEQGNSKAKQMLETNFSY